MKYQLIFAENFVDVRYKSIKNKQLRYRQYTIDMDCGLGRGNLQWFGVLYLSSQSDYTDSQIPSYEDDLYCDPDYPIERYAS